MERHRSRLGPRRRWLAVAPALFVALFFLWPVGAIVGRGLSGGAFVDLFHNAALRRVAWFTLWQAVVSTLVTMIVGLPMAFVLSRYRFAGRRAIESALIVPFVLPTVVVGAAYRALLPPRWQESVLAIVVAHVFFNVAVVVRSITPLWQQLDRRRTEAAATLGASPFMAARTIVVPFLRPALAAAASIVFLFSFTSFGVVVLLGGPRRRTIEVEIFQRMARLLDLRAASTLALFQLVVLAVVLGVINRRTNTPRVTSRAIDSSRAPNRWQLAIVLVPAAAFFLAPLAALVSRAGRWGSLLDATARAALCRSLTTAAVSAFVATVLGALAAVAIADGGRWTSVVNTSIVAPLGTSAVTIGFGLLITFNRGWLDLRDRWIMIPIAHALIGLPFVVRTAAPVLRAIDPRQRDAAATLGAAPSRVWLTIDAPRLRRALTIGYGFSFAVSLGEFGASSFLSRRTGPTLPILIGELLGKPGAAVRERAYALALVLAMVTAVVMIAVERLGTRDRH
jgi:thiamine transport system permease protein